MYSRPKALRAALLALGLSGAALTQRAAAQQPADFPEFGDPHLNKGREVWLGTCRACHANALSDAPQARDKAAWAARIGKGKEVLYRHAIGGFSGAAGTEMPARGGNDALTEAQVKAAVDYMIKLVTQQ